MAETIRIVCDNTGDTIEAAMGTSLLELERRLGLRNDRPFLAAYVNNRIKELRYGLSRSVRFLDITSFEGIRVYQRTAWFILQKAVRELYPGRKLYIRHSMSGGGFYCEVGGVDQFSHAETEALAERMRGIVASDLPIERTKMLTSEVRMRYAEEGLDDKIALLDTRPRLYSDLYTLGDTAGYSYGSPPHDHDRLQTDMHQEKMFGIFREYQSWVSLMGVPTIGAVNAQTLAGNAGGMIKIAEAFHERRFAAGPRRAARPPRPNGWASSWACWGCAP